MWYRGGCVAQALLRHDRQVSHNTVSLQSRLRREWSKCHLSEWFSPRKEIKFEKLALDVLANIQSLSEHNLNITHGMPGTARIPRVVSVTRSVLRCFWRNPAEDTLQIDNTFWTGPLTRSLGADESKGFFFKMMQLYYSWSTVWKAKLMQSSIDHAVFCDQ